MNNVPGVRIWNEWKYKYLSLLLIGLLVAVFLAKNEEFHNFLLHLGTLEYVGILIAGMLFVSSFTVATSIVLIGILTQNTHPLIIGLVGGIGAVIGDLLIFKYVKDHLTDELSLLFNKEGISYVKSVIRSKYISWTLPIMGIFIIASPLPDELGISLLGLSKISESKFVIISYLSNAFGIFAIASVVKVL